MHIGPEIQEKLWKRLAERIDVSDLGLRLGLQLGITWGGFVNLMAQVSPTLHHLLHDFGRYQGLFTDPNYYRHFGAVDLAAWTYFEISFPDTSMVCYPYYCRNTAEGMFVLALQVLQSLGKHPIKPARIDWQHARPSKSADLYKAIFNVPMQFNTGVNRLYFHKSDLSRPVVTRDPDLYAHFYKVAETSRLDEPHPWSRKVRACVLESLCNQQPVLIAAVADTLHISTRSLQ